MGEMDRRSFIIAGLFGRGLRFGLEALLIGIYGKKALDTINLFLDNEILIALGMIIFAAIGYFMWRWWSKIEIIPNKLLNKFYRDLCELL